jgi:hypothetical protein
VVGTLEHAVSVGKGVESVHLSSLSPYYVGQIIKLLVLGQICIRSGEVEDLPQELRMYSMINCNSCYILSGVSVRLKSA